MAKNTICLWYDKDAEAAARFYAETFPDAAGVLLDPREFPLVAACPARVLDEKDGEALIARNGVELGRVPIDSLLEIVE